MTTDIDSPGGAGPDLDEDDFARLYGEVYHSVVYSDDTDEPDRWHEIVQSTVRAVVASRWWKAHNDALVGRVRALEAERDDARRRMRYMSSPTMGLPPNRDALDYVRSGDVDPELARLALAVCIDNARTFVAASSPQTTHVPAATAEFTSPGYSAACSCGYEGSLVHPTEAEAIAEARAHQGAK